MYSLKNKNSKMSKNKFILKIYIPRFSHSAFNNLIIIVSRISYYICTTVFSRSLVFNFSFTSITKLWQPLRAYHSSTSTFWRNHLKQNLNIVSHFSWEKMYTISYKELKEILKLKIIQILFAYSYNEDETF